MVNVRGVPVLTVGSVLTVLIKGRKKQCCVHRRCKHLHVQTHTVQSAELNKDMPSLQKVLQDLSGTIYLLK